jgi:hypothetical protein
MADWRNRIIERRTMRIGDIRPNKWNPKGHPRVQQERLRSVLDRFGIVGDLLAFKDTDGDYTLFDGHARQTLDPDQEWPILFTDLSRQEIDELVLYFDPLAALARQEADRTAALMADLDVQERALREMLEEQAQGLGFAFNARDGSEVTSAGTHGDGVLLSSWNVPDALWPSDNAWGIPTLDNLLQANAVDLPVTLWGAVKRTKRMRGTWLFYCDDYRFEALWRDPSTVVNTRCVSAVEPNFSIGPQTPKAMALWQVYRKRWLARWWQSCGIRIFVDMNVDTETFADIMLLGVPKGWKAYATRGYSERLGFTVREYELACEHAETDRVLFLLYGGNKDCEELAKSRGWVWISEHMDAKAGEEVLNG